MPKKAHLRTRNFAPTPKKLRDFGNSIAICLFSRSNTPCRIPEAVEFVRLHTVLRSSTCCLAVRCCQSTLPACFLAVVVRLTTMTSCGSPERCGGVGVNQPHVAQWSHDRRASTMRFTLEYGAQSLLLLQSTTFYTHPVRLEGMLLPAML